MNIPCFYKNQRAYYQGVDKNKRMYQVKTEDGEIHHVNMLSQIDFKNHSSQEGLFKETA